MSETIDWLGRTHRWLYDPHRVHRGERVVVAVATVGFLVHLAIVFLARNGGGIDLDWFSSSYLSALYTPFSFLLFYEVLQLVAVLPSSFSQSIAKQYEIVTLIVVRRVFKDIAKLDAGDAIVLADPEFLAVGADMLGALALYAMARWFRRGCARHEGTEHPQLVSGFVAFKQAVSLLLGLLVVGLACTSLWAWSSEMWMVATGGHPAHIDVNAIFYEDFFGLLVLVDVLVLVISFGFTRDLDQVFRNAGYVASTVLVRLSFQAERLESLAVLLFAVAFAIAVQRITTTASAGVPETA